MKMRKEIIAILHGMQKWRRGKGKSMPYSPRQFGAAIDLSIRVLRGISEEEFNKLVNGKDDIRQSGQAVSEAFLREHEKGKEG